MKAPNEKTVTLKVKRIELCDIILAITLVSQESEAEKWKLLRKKLKNVLAEHDEAQGE